MLVRGLFSWSIVVFVPGLVGGVIFASPMLHSQQPPPKPDFGRDIYPLLKANCIECHGPNKQQGGLRLDSLESMKKGGVEGPVVIPGKAAASRLVRRMLADSPEYPRMPYGKPALSAEAIALLSAWIDDGAPWPTSTSAVHWAFVAPEKQTIPKANTRGWARNPIDAFILDKLERNGLTPSPEADRVTLIRRLSLDLTGIPPTTGEVDAFIADRSPRAYERVVDRLLASPRYGERMAMEWMDYARYADSNGYQADYERYAWRWRDWVIEAFNANMPYDQFTIEQIAGDLLPNATFSQRLATAFNRNHRINTEGGVIAEEWRVETVVDRVETTATVWLGLTAGCARCHDHKYDPISQKEFYQFYAYFNNVPESGTGEERPVNHPPLMKAPTAEQSKRLASVEGLARRLDRELESILKANAGRAGKWASAQTAANNHQLDNSLEGRYIFQSPTPITVGTAPQPTAVGSPAYEAGKASGAVSTSDGVYIDLGRAGDFERTDAFSVGAWVFSANGSGAPLARMDSGSEFRGWDMYLAGGRPMVHLIHRWPSNALKVRAKPTIAANQWAHLLFTYDGSAKPGGLRLYIDGRQVETEVENDSLTASIRTQVTTRIGGRTGSDTFVGKVDDAVLFRREFSPAEVAKLVASGPVDALLSIPKEKRTPSQRLAIIRAWSSDNDPRFRKLSDERQTVAMEIAKIEAGITTVMVMEEMSKPRDCFVLVRGQYDKPGDRVTPAPPAVFPPFAKGLPNNRLGLAHWLVSPQNPLTARVTVNRLWERLFGVGIVATSEDFGTRSEPPSHPELLDWLALELIRLKWDMKAMQKLIVTSATYRQSSAVSRQLLERDPTNRLLARGPRFRLSAETLRDQALAVSGLLTERIGGPSVRPYQPEGIWDETNVYGNLRNYKPDSGADLYRRSLYTIWKRTAAPPNMTLFDATGRETCRVRRARTNTPLQALVLLNEPTYVEAARALAQQMVARGGSSPNERIAYGFRRALGRSPSNQELAVLRDGFAKRLARFASDMDSARKLLSVGTAPTPSDILPAELAAYALTAAVILNLDEMVTKE